MLPGTNVQSGYTWVNGQGDVLLDIEYDNPGRCGWPAQYMMYQPHVETVLDELVRSTPSVELRRGVIVTAADQDDDGVTVTTKSPRGPDGTFALGTSSAATEATV